MKRMRGLKTLLNGFLFASLASNHSLAQPPVSAAPFQTGLAALQDNRYADALEQFTSAERDSPEDPRIHNFRGIALSRLGRNDQAVIEYREAIRLDPRMEDAYRNLGFLEWNEHQLEPAREALEHAVELSPSDSFAHYYLGRVQLEAQHYVQAIRELDTSRLPLPTDQSFTIEVATAYLALGRVEDARQSLHRIQTSSLDDAQSIRLAPLLLAVHESDAAIHLVERLVKPSSAGEASWLKFDVALVYLLAGHDGKSVEQARSYLEFLPPSALKSAESGQAWSMIGIAYAHMRQGGRSVDAFRQAASMAPDDEEHWLNLTRELMELNRYPDAILAVQEGLSANPKSYALHLRLGAAQLSAGHYAEAETVFRNLVAAGDPLPTSSIGLAQVLMRTGRADEAARELRDASQKLGPNFLLSYFRGLALDRAGKVSDAMTAFREAVQSNSSNAEAHLNLGKTELALGQVTDAIVELNETLRISPGNVQARRLLSQCYRRMGDSENAAKFAQGSTDVRINPEDDLLGDFSVPRWQAPSERSKTASDH